MGYILPVTNHTYNDYQKRVKKDTQSPHYIGKPYKTMLDIKQQELTKKRSNQIFVETIYQKRKQPGKRIPRENLDTKGLYVNKYV